MATDEPWVSGVREIKLRSRIEVFLSCCINVQFSLGGYRFRFQRLSERVGECRWRAPLFSRSTWLKNMRRNNSFPKGPGFKERAYVRGARESVQRQYFGKRNDPRARGMTEPKEERDYRGERKCGRSILPWPVALPLLGKSRLLPPESPTPRERTAILARPHRIPNSEARGVPPWLSRERKATRSAAKNVRFFWRTSPGRSWHSCASAPGPIWHFHNSRRAQYRLSRMLHGPLLSRLTCNMRRGNLAAVGRVSQHHPQHSKRLRLRKKTGETCCRCRENLQFPSHQKFILGPAGKRIAPTEAMALTSGDGHRPLLRPLHLDCNVPRNEQRGTAGNGRPRLVHSTKCGPNIGYRPAAMVRTPECHLGVPSIPRTAISPTQPHVICHPLQELLDQQPPNTSELTSRHRGLSGGISSRRHGLNRRDANISFPMRPPP